MKKQCLIGIVIILLSFLSSSLFGGPSTADQKLEPYIAIELVRIEETYRLLDRFSEEIWPGWNNFQDVEVQVHFPNDLDLLVTPKRDVPEGYTLIPGRIIYGKSVYLKREKMKPEVPRPPLIGARGRGGLLIRIDLAELELPDDEQERVALVEAGLKTDSDPKTPFNLAPLGDSETYILMLVHEHFHGFQAKHGRWGSNGEGLNEFEINADYAAYTQIEGLALLKAYNEKNDAEALEYIKDYLTARKIKHSSMPPKAAEGEPYFSVAEGVPSYTSLKMAKLIRDRSYRTEVTKVEDPYLFGFRYMDGYLYNLFQKGIPAAAQMTMEKRGKYYFYGALQCFLLDRFGGDWKNKFFENRKNLDEIMRAVVKISRKEEEDIRRRLISRYDFEAIRSRHEAALNRR